MNTAKSFRGLCPRPRIVLDSRGFTLVEVMVSAIVLAITLVAFLGTVIQAYRIDEAARRRDQVRAVVQSFADDFSRMTITNPPSPFFQASIAASGAGLVWTGSTNDGSGLKFRLGNDLAAPEVTLTRWVQDMNEASGVPDDVRVNTSGIGREIVCRFEARWRVDNREQTYTLWVVRADT
ncbi:MAG: type II secretion system protein [Opitutaceae bacterium]|nr:type II secretion system protein [Opitutaceae bacterium]